MRKLLFAIVLYLFFSANSISAQSPVITLDVRAGFAGYFRDSAWTPILVHVANDGDSISGRLVVRPETSGSGILNTYGTPVTLPTGARQTAFLYITARSFATQVRVELLDDAGGVVAAQAADLRAIQPQDRLNLVVTDSPVGAVDLTGVHSGRYTGFQADMALSDLPARQALESVDLIMFADVDTGALSSTQRQALADWVTAGGQLIVTGGQNWQATAAGFTDLLPLTPDASRDENGLQPLGDWLRSSADLSAATVISTGTLQPDAQVLVSAADGTPLLVRRAYGAGEVDYLAADPNNAPLRGWDGLPELWLTLVTNDGPRPGWSSGFVDWESAARAAEIVPGYDPLPDVLPLCGFLALYIGLIGPLNYLVLNRINRREWAWFTIPAFILLFSVLAYVLGFNLRGNEVTLNRIAVVQSWPNSARARVDQLVGLLSPRRAQYSLTTATGDVLRPLPRPLQTTSLLTRNTQSSIDVRESEQFVAQDFNVDASFIASFHLDGIINKPQISGQATIAADPAIAGQQLVRGSVRNDSAVTLTDPVILARGIALHLDQALAPGDVVPFELTLTGENAPAPALRVAAYSTSSLLSLRTTSVKQSVLDIMGENYLNLSAMIRLTGGDTRAVQINRRRQYFLAGLIDDYAGTSGRGDRVYLAGWTDSAPLTTTVAGASWNSQDTTLYLIELASELVPPPSSVTIAPDRFSWLVTNYTGLADVAPVNTQLQPGEEASFRFTPLPDAVLKRVFTLTVNVNNVSSSGLSVPFYLWNWERGDWERLNTQDELATIVNPARFLGPQNAVQVRLVADDIGGYVRINRLNIAQTGTF